MHTIRLRGPWQYTPLAHTYWTEAAVSIECDTDVPAPGRLTLPSDWEPVLGKDFRGKVLFQRQFNLPTGLHESSIVQLSVESVDAMATLYLNHHTLGNIALEQSSATFEIQQHLEPTNLLEIAVDLPTTDAHSAALPRAGRTDQQAGGITGEVQLVILEE